MKALNDAAIARAEAVWNAAQVHKTGEVPGTPTTPYLALSVGPGSPDTYRAGNAHTSKGYRLAVQAFGKSINELSVAVERAETAFLGHRLTPACTPCRSEVSSPVLRDPDAGGLLGVTITYRFAEEATA